MMGLIKILWVFLVLSACGEMEAPVPNLDPAEDSKELFESEFPYVEELGLIDSSLLHAFTRLDSASFSTLNVSGFYSSCPESPYLRMRSIGKVGLPNRGLAPDFLVCLNPFYGVVLSMAMDLVKVKEGVQFATFSFPNVGGSLRPSEMHLGVNNQERLTSDGGLNFWLLNPGVSHFWKVEYLPRLDSFAVRDSVMLDRLYEEIKYADWGESGSLLLQAFDEMLVWDLAKSEFVKSWKKKHLGNAYLPMERFGEYYAERQDSLCLLQREVVVKCMAVPKVSGFYESLIQAPNGELILRKENGVYWVDFEKKSLRFYQEPGEVDGKKVILKDLFYFGGDLYLSARFRNPEDAYLVRRFEEWAEVRELKL